MLGLSHTLDILVFSNLCYSANFYTAFIQSDRAYSCKHDRTAKKIVTTSAMADKAIRAVARVSDPVHASCPRTKAQTWARIVHPCHRYSRLPVPSKSDVSTEKDHVFSTEVLAQIASEFFYVPRPLCLQVACRWRRWLAHPKLQAARLQSGLTGLTGSAVCYGRMQMPLPQKLNFIITMFRVPRSEAHTLQDACFTLICEFFPAQCVI